MPTPCDKQDGDVCRVFGNGPTDYPNGNRVISTNGGGTWTVPTCGGIARDLVFTTDTQTVKPKREGRSVQNGVSFIYRRPLQEHYKFGRFVGRHPASVDAPQQISDICHA